MKTSQRCDDETSQCLTPDSFLGESSQRYFGSNFKEVNHHLDKMRMKDSILFADFSIQWPSNWSKKKGVSLQPHIGTLDFFLLASILAETYFRTAKNMPEKQIGKMWITEFYCKAGSKCIERNTAFCKCQLVSETSTGNQSEFTLEIAIADAAVTLKILSPNQTDKNESIVQGTEKPTHCESYYSANYKEASRDITNIRICNQERSITADFKLTHTEGLYFNGLGSAYMPCMTFCDLVLVCGQLSQILLYQLDNTERERASNLWLRNIRCIYKKPINKNTKVCIKVKESRMVNLKGLYYNCSDLVFNFDDGNLIAESSSAYQPFAK